MKSIDDLIAEIKARVGTRFEGQEPRTDERLVAEIERLRVIEAAAKAAGMLDERGEARKGRLERVAVVPFNPRNHEVHIAFVFDEAVIAAKKAT